MSLVYCSYDFIDENAAPVGKPFIVPATTDFHSMLVKSVISCSTVLTEAAILKQHPFSKQYYHEDYALWMKLMSCGVTTGGCQEVLAHYRKLDGSRSNNKLKAAKERMRINREYLRLPFFTRVYAAVGYVVNAVLKYYI